MKIYTRKGDDGTTGLIGGTRVSKDELRIESYGTVDELNSYIGWVRDLSSRKEFSDMLVIIQDKLFTIGSHLAADPEKSRMKLPDILEEDVTMLEKWIDGMDANLPEMKNFVLPGGHPAVSCCHVTRCVCRRAERLVVALSKTEKVETVILHYLNRLSDFLFTLSRSLAKDLNAPETLWNPK